MNVHVTIQQSVLAMAGGLFLLLLTVFPFSMAMEGPDTPHPQELKSFDTRQDNSEGVGSGCSYTVRIRTSCSSSKYNRDVVSIAFGDAYGNQVYSPWLQPPSGAFQRCSSNVFNIDGPCGHGICYIQLYRHGHGKNGWMPTRVRVSEVSYRRPPVIFYYGFWLPNHQWSGFNRCGRILSGVTNATELPDGSRERRRSQKTKDQRRNRHPGGLTQTGQAQNIQNVNKYTKRREYQSFRRGHPAGNPVRLKIPSRHSVKMTVEAGPPPGTGHPAGYESGNFQICF